MPRNVHDIEWLGLELTGDALRATLAVQQRHLSPTGRLYGGAAVGAALTVMEEATGRRPIWVTVQFASSCGLGDVLDLRTTVSAAGHRTSQLRLVATLGDSEVFAALGAVRSADPTAPPAPASQWGRMPDVAGPEGLEPLSWEPPFATSHLASTEMRVAVGPGDRQSAHMAIWCRPVGSGPLSPAVLGWQADVLGFAIGPATSMVGASSLDNTVRFGSPADPLDEWVLADIHGQVATGGTAHGTVDLWSPAGTLLAVGSQSCLLRRPPDA